MEEILLEQIEKQETKLLYVFSVTEGLKQFFPGRPFQIEYPFSLEAVPDAVLAVPFVCAVLPVVWITNAKLRLPELDEAFFNCIPAVKHGYETMYPETEFRGVLEVGRIVPCARPAKPDCCGMFFSGGADSLDTLYRHLAERPSLLAIWGSDIKYDNAEGWKPLETVIQESAYRYQLSTVFIHSSFREFDSEGQLNYVYANRLKDNWWHGMKHGLALLGHVAPYAYLTGMQTMYIASTNSPEDGAVRCASNPLIDNQVRFAACTVVHDGFECSRQKKIGNIVRYAKQNHDSPQLHVCWETQTGRNCCHCEKCFRTIVAILAEGGDPGEYGFPGYENSLPDLKEVLKRCHPETIRRFWPAIQEKLLQDKKQGIPISCEPMLRFVERANFKHPESFQTSLRSRLKASSLREKLARFRFYQYLHEIKASLRAKRS